MDPPPSVSNKGNASLPTTPRALKSSSRSTSPESQKATKENRLLVKCTINE